VIWSASFIKATTPPPDSARKRIPRIGKVVYPFDGYGWDSLPRATGSPDPERHGLDE